MVLGRYLIVGYLDPYCLGTLMGRGVHTLLLGFVGV